MGPAECKNFDLNWNNYIPDNHQAKKYYNEKAGIPNNDLDSADMIGWKGNRKRNIIFIRTLDQTILSLTI